MLKIMKKMSIRKKEYYNENKEYFNEYDRTRNQDQERKMKKNIASAKMITCICGTEIRYDSQWKHFKTKKHLDFINSQQ